MDSKPFWASKTIWVNGVSVLAAILAAAGVTTIGAEMQAEIVALVMGAVNIVLRFVTHSSVG